MVYLAIGLAGALGAVLRYWLGEAVSGWWTNSFPIATLVINYLGCIALGWFTGRVSKLPSFPPWLRTGIATGLIGSFTTFSTFSVETLNLLQNGQWMLALLYVLLSLWGGLVLAWWGIRKADTAA
jgi:CrcB protein